MFVIFNLQKSFKVCLWSVTTPLQWFISSLKQKAKYGFHTATMLSYVVKKIRHDKNSIIFKILPPYNTSGSYTKWN